MPPDGGPRPGPEGSFDRVGFRWTCPFCSASRSNPAGEESDEDNAVTALRSHILASDDDEHGPAKSYPGNFDPATLADHVVPVDGRETAIGSEG